MTVNDIEQAKTELSEISRMIHNKLTVALEPDLSSSFREVQTKIKDLYDWLEEKRIDLEYS